ncbi:DNA helicase Pif1 like protein, partial [Rhizophagus diaphanus]
LLNKDQHVIYDAVIQAVDNDCSCFFDDRPGGTEKTFLYSTLLAIIRACGEIALAVASSGIAALLISGGKTAYSRFKISIKLDESSTCNISHINKKACLISMTNLLIWDEASMTHKFAFKQLIKHFMI